eukprot:12881451-Prorocentrum_lima.AAC.1
MLASSRGLAQNGGATTATTHQTSTLKVMRGDGGIERGTERDCGRTYGTRCRCEARPWTRARGGAETRRPCYVRFLCAWEGRGRRWDA